MGRPSKPSAPRSGGGKGKGAPPREGAPPPLPGAGNPGGNLPIMGGPGGSPPPVPMPPPPAAPPGRGSFGD